MIEAVIRWSITNRVTVLMLAALLGVWGLYELRADPKGFLGLLRRNIPMLVAAGLLFGAAAAAYVGVVTLLGGREASLLLAALRSGDDS
mgnify:CR=1 FL=1